MMFPVTQNDKNNLKLEFLGFSLTQLHVKNSQHMSSIGSVENEDLSA